jgi:tRNA (guanine-N7-)-methyltransferase
VRQAGGIDGPDTSLRPPPPPGSVATTKVRGRMSAAKLRTLAELGPRYGIALDPDRPLADRLDEAFCRTAPRLLDVGIGRGEATVAWALAHPGRDVVAVEVHRPSVAATLLALDGAGATNGRVVEVDVRTVLDQAAPGDLHDVRILFPDPWTKRRHHGRRMVDAALAARTAAIVPPGGTLHVATDHAGYAAHVVATLSADDRWDVDPAAERPERPVTTYEALGRAAGRTIHDVIATRR